MHLSKRTRFPHTASLLVLLAACFTATPLFASPLRPNPLITDNMVLQQGMKAPLWGWADPGEKITISLNGQKASATTDPDGRWQVALGPFKPGGPYDMRINGETDSSSLTISNVLVGEVWVCSGQSNMEMAVSRTVNGYRFGVKNAAQEVASANYPQIRMFLADKQLAGKPAKILPGAWTVCSSDNVSSFSATAYFFGREIHKNLNVPVGLIKVPWPGCPIQALMSRESLEAIPEVKPEVENMDKAVENYKAAVAQYMAQLQEWEQQCEKLEADGGPNGIRQPIFTVKDARGSNLVPTRIFNGMVAPVIPYGIKGVIWYQGETNANRSPELYNKLFPALITDWRERWHQGNFPFLYVQLANFDATPTAPLNVNWAVIREAQLKALSLPNTGMAVAADIGESKNIHPINKQEVGRRLALAALAKTYGKNIAYSGPIYDSMKLEGKKIRLKFKQTDSGLRAKDTNGNLSADAPLNTFTIAGPDQQFVPAQAKIEGKTVVVWSDSVSDPTAVRYAWSNDPVGCNLYNQSSLPASPFRTDTWLK